MSKTAKTKVIANSFNRNGEGTLISAKPNSIVGTDGQTAVVLGFNLLEAPVPDRRYAADFATLIYKNNVLKLIFGQEKLGVAGNRSLVVIAMHAPDVIQMLETLQSMQAPSLDELVEQVGIKAADLPTISEEPEQTIALAANFVAVAVSGHAACLDFYSASAFSIANIIKAQKLAVDAVVRIDLPASYFVAIRDALIKMKDTFSPDLVGEKS